MKKLLFAVLAAGIMFNSCTFISIKRTDDADGEKGLLSLLSGKHVEAKGPIVEKYFNVAEFDAIVCNIPCKLDYSSEYSSVNVSGPQNAVEDLKVYVQDRVLNISFDKNKYFNLKEMKVTVTSLALNSLCINGAVEFNATKSGIGADDFRLEVNGAGEIEIDPFIAKTATFCFNGAADAAVRNIDCGKLDINVNGAADCKLTGKADSAVISVNGAGDIDVSGLECPDVVKNKNGIATIFSAK